MIRIRLSEARDGRIGCSLSPKGSDLVTVRPEAASHSTVIPGDILRHILSWVPNTKNWGRFRRVSRGACEAVESSRLFKNLRSFEVNYPQKYFRVPFVTAQNELFLRYDSRFRKAFFKWVTNYIHCRVGEAGSIAWRSLLDIYVTELRDSLLSHSPRLPGGVPILQPSEATLLACMGRDAKWLYEVLKKTEKPQKLWACAVMEHFDELFGVGQDISGRELTRVWINHYGLDFLNAHDLLAFMHRITLNAPANLRVLMHADMLGWSSERLAAVECYVHDHGAPNSLMVMNLSLNNLKAFLTFQRNYHLGLTVSNWRNLKKNPKAVDFLNFCKQNSWHRRLVNAHLLAHVDDAVFDDLKKALSQTKRKIALSLRDVKD